MGKTVGYKVQREMLLDQGESVVFSLLNELEAIPKDVSEDTSPASMLAAIELLKKQKVGKKDEE